MRLRGQFDERSILSFLDVFLVPATRVRLHGIAVLKHVTNLLFVK
jgi:hypothetical protein